MSIHILVPQERLADLLKCENTLELLHVRMVGAWSAHEEALSGNYESFTQDERVANGTLLPYAAYDSFINDLIQTKAGLANYLGYQYTVDTDAAYFESLEDMLGAEE